MESKTAILQSQLTMLQFQTAPALLAVPAKSFLAALLAALVAALDRVPDLVQGAVLVQGLALIPVPVLDLEILLVLAMAAALVAMLMVLLVRLALAPVVLL